MLLTKPKYTYCNAGMCISSNPNEPYDNNRTKKTCHSLEKNAID